MIHTITCDCYALITSGLVLEIYFLVEKPGKTIRERNCKIIKYATHLNMCCNHNVHLVIILRRGFNFNISQLVYFQLPKWGRKASKTCLTTNVSATSCPLHTRSCFTTDFRREMLCPMSDLRWLCVFIIIVTSVVFIRILISLFQR